MNMHEYVDICIKCAVICTNMHKILMCNGKYAEICRNMQKYAEICKYMSGLRKVPCYEKMQEICKHMQNMQSRIVCAAHAETCTPHFVLMIRCCRMITSIISSRAAERWLAAVAQVVGSKVTMPWQPPAPGSSLNYRQII
jgi:hypothetical protein